MDHGPTTDWGDDLASEYKTRLGLWMFLVYGLVYASFVVVNSVWPHLMARSLASLNIAIVYGFGLIVLALIMAFIYNAMCSRFEERIEREALSHKIDEAFTDEDAASDNREVSTP